MSMAPLIAREVLLRDPERLNPRVSPDGTKLAFLAPVDGVANLWVGDLDGDEAKPVTRERGRGIGMGGHAPEYRWSADGRHLLYCQDEQGDESWRLYRVDVETTDTVLLAGGPGIHVRLLGASPDVPDAMLIGLNDRDPRFHDVYRLDLGTGATTLVLRNEQFVDFLADRRLVLRAATRRRSDGGVDVLVRDTDEGPWRVVHDIAFEDCRGLSLVAFEGDGDTLLLCTPKGADTARLVRLDLRTGQEEVLAAHDGADVSAVLLDPATWRPQVATVLEARTHHLVLDDAVAADLAALGSMAQGDVAVLSRDDADGVWIVADVRSDAPTVYLRYDRARCQVTRLFSQRPELDRAVLAVKEPFSITTRDGLTVHGYLSFPPGAPRERLPVVLWVHGGPWHRDVWGFDPYVQLFANRGYLVAQVNFRGSTGYGKAFLSAGDREWGGRMHDDLLDVVDDLVARGWADPERIAIAGGSYGGYAALAGAAFTPGRFACAVDIFGIANLLTVLRSLPAYWGPELVEWRRRVGDPDTDEAFLWSRSPLARVDDIRCPLLVVHTANDPRVAKSESDQIVEAMRRRGIPHEYVVVEGEGHGFGSFAARDHVFGIVERFLAEHLGGRCQGPTQP